MFVFSPKLFVPFFHVNTISTSVLSPGCNNTVSVALVVTLLSPSFTQPYALLSSSLNSSPSGIKSVIFVANPSISPSFVTLILYVNFTVVLFSFFLSTSTFAIGSAASLLLIPVVSVFPVFGLNPVSVTVVFPSTVTVVFVTHFNKLKSNIGILTFSMSSSSSSCHLFGILILLHLLLFFYLNIIMLLFVEF